MYKNLYCNTMIDDIPVISLTKDFNNNVLTLPNDYFFRNIIYVYNKYKHTILRVLSDDVLRRLLFDIPPTDCIQYVHSTIYPDIILNCILYGKEYIVEGMNFTDVVPDDFYDIIYDHVAEHIRYYAMEEFSMAYDYTFNSSGWKLRNADDSSTILIYMLGISKTLYEKLLPFMYKQIIPIGSGPTVYLNGLKDKHGNDTHAMEIAWRLQEVLKRIVKTEQLNHNITLYDSRNNGISWNVYDDNPSNNLIYKHLIRGGGEYGV